MAKNDEPHSVTGLKVVDKDGNEHDVVVVRDVADPLTPTIPSSTEMAGYQSSLWSTGLPTGCWRWRKNSRIIC